MKGYIKGKTIIILESLPEILQDGDEVNISIKQIYDKQKYPFPTFQLGVKEEYLSRDKMYEQE